MLKMQIDLTSMARRWYNVIKRRCFNVKIRRPHDAKQFTLKRRCENVENANRSDVDCKTFFTTSLNDVDFMSKLDVNQTSIILRQNIFLKMMKRQIELTSIPGHSYNVHSVIESRAVTRTLIGGVNIRIYSCSARQISFQIDQLELGLKKYSSGRT